LNVRALLGFAALVLAACVTTPPIVMIPVTGSSPVEEQILVSYRAYTAVNASLGATEIVYSTNVPASASRYQSVIQRRIERDLKSYYRRPIHRAERVYLLFGAWEGRDLVEVVRLGTLSPERRDRQTFDGLQQVETLTYVFEPSTRALVEVYGPVAGEY
jgi:hypothetical protein